MPAVNAVRIIDGETQLAVIFERAYSTAHERLSDRRYALFATYSESPTGGRFTT